MTARREIAELERQAAELAPQIRDVLAGVAAVAAGQVPARYAVTRALLSRGIIERNAARHAYVAADLVAPGEYVGRCGCGWRSPVTGERADDDGAVYDGELWAAAAVDVHADGVNVGVPFYVLTADGARFADQARRYGGPR